MEFKIIILKLPAVSAAQNFGKAMVNVLLANIFVQILTQALQFLRKA